MNFFKKYRGAPLFVLGGLLIVWSHAMRGKNILHIIPGLLIATAGIMLTWIRRLKDFKD